MHYLSGLEKPLILSFSNPQLVVAAVPVAVVVAVAAGADADDAAGTAAASENEFGAAETAVQPRKCALLGYWDIAAGPLQKKQSSSWVHHLAFDQSVPSDAEFLLSTRHLMLSHEQNNIGISNKRRNC